VSAPGERLAVVDVGSNSIRLLLCEGMDPAGPRGERLATVTGLRRGADAEGRVADDAIARIDRCLARYAERIAAFGPEGVIAVGTSAVREAPDRERIARVVRARLGVGLRVLSGEEEAAAAFAGARLAAEPDEPVMVVDVGGGSTELVRGGPSGPEAVASLPLGAVRQTEAHLRADPPRPEELAALRREARALVEPAIAAVGGPATTVGVAGTITSLAAVELGGYDPERVHRHRLSREGVERLAARLAAIPGGERRRVPGLDPARADVIVAGALIVAVVLDVAGREELMVSERDLLDGVALAAAGATGSLAL
jgi:exopolyphosphatase / guanosine-5'-triphosphate,3'-diphosphate pyrophosphatase